jgi:hypothetical protein
LGDYLPPLKSTLRTYMRAYMYRYDAAASKSLYLTVPPDSFFLLYDKEGEYRAMGVCHLLENLSLKR